MKLTPLLLTTSATLILALPNPTDPATPLNPRANTTTDITDAICTFPCEGDYCQCTYNPSDQLCHRVGCIALPVGDQDKCVVCDNAKNKCPDFRWTPEECLGVICKAGLPVCRTGAECAKRAKCFGDGGELSV